MKHIPYVYFLKNKSTSLKYVGVRYAKGCSPDDFWTKYFTSSKSVHKLIEEFGKDDFIFRILHIFPSDPEAAIKKEAEYFSLIKKKDDYVNLTYSSGCQDLRINSKAGKIGGNIVKNKKIGIFDEKYDDKRKEWASKAGKIGGTLQAERGEGFHQYKKNPELHKKWASMGGKASGQFQNIEFQSEMGKRGGVKNKGFVWYNDGTNEFKYTKNEQDEISFEEFLSKNKNYSKGRIIKKAQCPTCKKIGNISAMYRHHFNNCKKGNQNA